MVSTRTVVHCIFLLFNFYSWPLRGHPPHCFANLACHFSFVSFFLHCLLWFFSILYIGNSCKCVNVYLSRISFSSVTYLVHFRPLDTLFPQLPSCLFPLLKKPLALRMRHLLSVSQSLCVAHMAFTCRSWYALPNCPFLQCCKISPTLVSPFTCRVVVFVFLFLAALLSLCNFLFFAFNLVSTLFQLYHPRFSSPPL